MTHIEQAIRDAVEKGGYCPLEKYDGGNLRITLISFEKNLATFHSRTTWGDGVRDEDISDITLDHIFLDPLFWKCLGKVRRWKESASVYNEKIAARELWHRFIDALADGKTAEEFFATLV